MYLALDVVLVYIGEVILWKLKCDSQKDVKAVKHFTVQGLQRQIGVSLDIKCSCSGIHTLANSSISGKLFATIAGWFCSKSPLNSNRL